MNIHEIARADQSSRSIGGERRTGSRQTTIQEIACCRATEPGALRRELRGDMDWIVMKAMEKQRARRYASASELAADIHRHLRHEPVLAGSPSTMYRVGKFVRRHRAGVISAALVLVMLVAGVTGTGWGLVVAKKNARISDRIAYRASMAAAGRALLNNDVTEARKHLDTAPTRLRGWEWRHFQSRLDQSLMTIHLEDVETNPAHTGCYWGPVTFTCDGATFWFVSQWQARGPVAARLLAWNLQSGKQVVSRDLESQLDWYDLDSDPDGVRVAWFAHPRSTLHVEDALTGENRVTMFVDEAFDAGEPPETSGDEHLFSTSVHGFNLISYSGALHWGMLHRAPIWDPVTSIPASNTSEDGRLAVTLGWDRSVDVGEVLVWNVHTGALVQRITDHPERVHNAVFSPDAERLVTVCEDGVIRIWDVKTGEPADWETARGHSDRIRAVPFSPDGSLLATGSQDRTIRLWNARTGQPLGVLLGHTDQVLVLTFSPDGSTLISIAKNGTMRMWDPHSTHPSNVIGRHDSYVYPVAFTPDGTQIASGGFDGFVRLGTRSPAVSAQRLRSPSPAQPTTRSTHCGSTTAPPASL